MAPPHWSRIALTVIALATLLSRPAPAAGPPRSIDCVDTRQWAELAAQERLRPGLPGPMRTLGPPANPQVGDTWNWYIWNLAGAPTATLQPCTVRGEGPNIYVVVRDADWGTLVTQADVDSVLEHAETRSYGLDPTSGFVPLDLRAFGDPPLGLDLDPKMYLLYYDFAISSDGFAGWADPFPDTGVGFNKSNECEVLYLNCGPDAGLDHSPSGNYMLAVAAHELEHIIHRGYDADEENWLDESLAEVGMYLFDPASEFIDSFRANADVSLTLNNPAGSYGARYFWGMHLFDDYGGFAGTRALVAEPSNGIASVDLVLAAEGHPEGFRGAFDSWVVANWLDDPSIAGGIYGYDLFDYGPFTAVRTHATYPVASVSGSVSRWAADYISFDGFAPDGLRVSFTGSAANRFSVQLIATDSTGARPPRVLPMALNASQAGVLRVSAEDGCDTATLVVAAIDPSANTSSYTYGADILASIDLRVRKAAPGFTRDLVLDWTTSAAPPFDVLRSTDAATLVSSPQAILPASGYSLPDNAVPGALQCYVVQQP
jgi:hypothetical protein